MPYFILTYFGRVQSHDSLARDVSTEKKTVEFSETFMLKIIYFLLNAFLCQLQPMYI